MVRKVLYTLPKFQSKSEKIELAKQEPVPQFPFTKHSHTTSTSNFNPKVSLGNAPIFLHQMRSEIPIMSAQVKHAFSNNPLFER
jgi:hypothetical protein